MGTWTILRGPGSSTTAEVVGQPTAVALTSPAPAGWGTNPRYRVSDDGLSQVVDISIRITPANDPQTAGFDIVMDKAASGVLTPIDGFYTYQNTVPAPQNFVVTANRPQTTETWVFVVGTRGKNGAFNAPDESIAATKTSASITGYSPGTGTAPGVTGFSVQIIDDVGAPVPQSHFKFLFTPPVNPNYYRIEIFMIYCDDPALHTGAYVPKVGASQFLVAGARTSPSEQTGWWARGSIGSWILATAQPENIIGIPNIGANATYGFFIGPAGTGTIPANVPAGAVTGLTVTVITDSNAQVHHGRFRISFTPPASDPNWVSCNIDMVFCDDPATHGGSYVPKLGENYFPVAVGMKTSGEQKDWWTIGSIGSWILTRATSLNLASVLNTAAVATYGFFLSPNTSGPIPDNNIPSDVSAFVVTVVDDPASPVQQSHFKFTWTAAGDPQFTGIHVDMIFCDDPSTHGGAYVPQASAQWFLVAPRALISPAEQTSWWPRGSAQGWLTARALSLNLMGIAKNAGPLYNFTITPATSGRLPDNGVVGAISGFSVTIIDDTTSPIPQSHFKFFWTIPVGDPNYNRTRFDMIFCDDPATHGGAYVPVTGGHYFFVGETGSPPLEQTNWWPRGTLPGWVQARAMATNLLGVLNIAAALYYGFTIPATTGARLNNVDPATVSGGLQAPSGVLAVKAGSTIDISSGSVAVKLATLDSSHLIAGSLGQDLSKFASTARPIVVVSGLPALPNASYPNGALIFNTVTGKNYRNVSGTWTVGTDPADLIAGTIAAGVVYAGTIVATQVTSGGFTGITLTLNLNAVTTTINNSTGVLGPTGVQVANNANPQMTQMCPNGFIVNNNAGSSAHAAVLYFDVGGSNGGILALWPSTGAQTATISAGSGSGGSIILGGTTPTITVQGTGYVDANGGYKVNGTQRLTANGGLMPRLAGSFATLAALSTSLGANWANGELLMYFNTTTSKNTFAFKDASAVNHDLAFAT